MIYRLFLILLFINLPIIVRLNLSSFAQEQSENALSQEMKTESASPQSNPQGPVTTEAAKTVKNEQGSGEQTTVTSSTPENQLPASLTASENVTLDFKDAEINNVLKIISLKSGFNIVATPDVIGNVTIRLVDVPWERALDVILKTYGYAYEKQGNVILVTKAENISKIQAEESLKTEVFNLKFLDAQDAQKVLIPLLSPRGKISLLYAKGQKGWKFGTFKIGKGGTTGQELIKLEEARPQSETVSIEKTSAGGVVTTKVELPGSVKSKVLVITDTAAALDRIRNFLEEIDKKPKQVLIEARIMEVNTDKLRDIGFDWGTGTGGATTYTTAPTDLGLTSKGRETLAGRNLGSEFTPSIFGPKEGTTAFPGTYPYKAGLELLFKKLGGTQFEVILHALDQDVNTNVLSAPRIVTLDNQEASILVGYHTPILNTTVTGGTSTEGPTQTQTLDYYQEIGIRLNVVPQISLEGYINMIIHPSITSSTSNVTATSAAGTGSSRATVETTYPIIDVREAQTQVMMKDGETIVIGGLLKDVKSKEVIGIPFLSKIPLLGALFKRETEDIQKVDLLIFITARVIKEEEFSPEEIAKLENRLGYGEKQAIPRKKEKNK